MALYTYKDGPVVTLHGAWNYMPKFPFRMAFSMVLEKASFEFNSLVDMDLHVYPSDGTALTPKIDSADGYLLEEKYPRVRRQGRENLDRDAESASTPCCGRAGIRRKW